ncbi:Endoribonuclease YbeY [Clostridium bornimense]|uniref:Endoribonuclease YbeY n=1 Tax=Clostridium bornimense TaxID=1216932 RepID=W6RYC1_9CLOT|nr:rRNA maturation RNase YbeY [Clostridium bornimense]CDM68629.1 Endoribonuclease YbeY [Clostridium bornimense]
MIYIENNQSKKEVKDELNDLLEEVINFTIEEEKVDVDVEVSLLYVDNEEIKNINKEFRKIDRVTDVLSFPMLSYPEGKVYKDIYYKDKELLERNLDNGVLILGDIVLSLERAEEQRIEFGHSFLREAAYLTVHSVLHLLGYDHINDSDKEKMRRREEEILNKFQITR